MTSGSFTATLIHCLHKGHCMTTKTRAQKTVEMLRDRVPATSELKVREVKQPDTAGMDKLAKRRAALKKLHDFKDGVV